MAGEPVAEGQWRQGGLVTVWAVLERHPRRRGFWLCVSHNFPHEVVALGRHELEALPLVRRDHFGDEGHPGESYFRALRGIRRTS